MNAMARWKTATVRSLATEPNFFFPASVRSSCQAGLQPLGDRHTLGVRECEWLITKRTVAACGLEGLQELAVRGWLPTAGHGNH